MARWNPFTKRFQPLLLTIKTTFLGSLHNFFTTYITHGLSVLVIEVWGIIIQQIFHAVGYFVCIENVFCGKIPKAWIKCYNLETQSKSNTLAPSLKVILTCSLQILLKALCEPNSLHHVCSHACNVFHVLVLAQPQEL